jgi:hypothetical protein
MSSPALSPGPTGLAVCQPQPLANSGSAGQTGQPDGQDRVLSGRNVWDGLLAERLRGPGWPEAKTVSDETAGQLEKSQDQADRATQNISTAGGRVIGREVTVEAAGVRTKPDLYVEFSDGATGFIEVKTGPTASLTPNQSVGYPAIRSTGGVPVGDNAAMAGLTPGVPIGPTPVTVVHQPWPLP